MTLEQYNQLPYDYAHYAGTHCEKTSQCIRHTAFTMLETGGREQYIWWWTRKWLRTSSLVRSSPLTAKERFTWGILRIYDNVRLADLSDIQQNLIYTFGHTAYYLIKRKERVLTESKQKEIRDIFTDKGYDGSVIEFESYEEQHPTLMRTYKRV